MNYWVALVTRNGGEHIRGTLDSIFSQSLKPRKVIVVVDGSTDGTERLLAGYTDQYQALLEVVSLPDRGYDIRRVPSNINVAWNRAQALSLGTGFFMISGDDCIYPRDYVENLITRMECEPGLVVTSGRPSAGGGMSYEHSPSGSGRLVRCSFWRIIGSAYPLKAGWETWLLYKAREIGFKVALIQNVTFRHVRPRGAKHQFAYWGAAMHGLGYLPLYALGRIVKNLAIETMPLEGSMNMLRGYLAACLGSSDTFIAPFDRSLRDFVGKDQLRGIHRLSSALLGRAPF